MAETSLAQASPNQPHPSEESPPPKPYHAKRPHKKSRSGCQSCKARKVKCDEARPVCRSCRLRRADCVYATAPKSQISADTTPSSSDSLDDGPLTHFKPAAAVASPTTAKLASISSTSSVLCSTPILTLAERHNAQSSHIPAELLCCPMGIDEADMKALWFYATQTCTSFSTVEDDGHHYIMRSLLVRYGPESPFLLDSIFALAGLHMQRLNQQFDAKRALSYRVKALAGYRKAIEEAKPGDFPALAVNSLLLTALSSEHFREPDGKQLYILDWLVVWKGILLVMNIVSKSTVVESGLNGLFFRPKSDVEKAAAFIPSHLLLLISSISPSDPEYPLRETYHQTLKYLGSLYMDLALGPSPMMSLRTITIFTFLPSLYIDAARMLQPRALVILAHFAAFFKLVQWSVWWLEGVGDRTMRDICLYLDAQWQPFLQVPFAALNAQGHTQLAKIILEDADVVSPLKSLVGYDDVQLGRQGGFSEVLDAL
ncbi:hypothetical protein A9Z42_0033900 [Trichoderma parareesei]|uniref:Zn(2)-C6 fungal-type domain-containing protein n=1 Tax=Trichoderma parareesei TaxID=858221 RepID=A0A2H2ZLH0_TRIPA|nr:hypothetical protein A9Z42_0033900 [Trichoderma parareesei]